MFTKMHFYNISIGEYDDFESVDIYHEKEFTHHQFAKMYNSVICKIGKTKDAELVAREMCNEFGFKIVEAKLTIRQPTGYLKEISEDDIELNDDVILVIDEETYY